MHGSPDSYCVLDSFHCPARRQHILNPNLQLAVALSFRLVSGVEPVLSSIMCSCDFQEEHLPLTPGYCPRVRSETCQHLFTVRVCHIYIRVYLFEVARRRHAGESQ